MKILKLEWKNIFSYGDDIAMIEFGDDAKLWQLSGKSGSGKSSLLSIPKLLLFGKTEGSGGKPVKVGNIANWTNKKGWIRGEVSKGNDAYVIERTFAPSGLSITKNGEPIDKAGIGNMQNFIDREILDGMPYHIFANVMTLSLNNFKSFISMSPADKRLIIDKIFSLEIVNKVHELVKDDMKNLGNSINSSNSQIYALDQTIQTSQSELNSISEGAVSGGPERLEELKQKLEKVAQLYNSQNELRSSAVAKLEELRNTENQISWKVREDDIAINQLKQKLNLFAMDKCPTCGTSFASEDFASVRESLNTQLENVSRDRDTLAVHLASVQSAVAEGNSRILEIDSNIRKVQAKQNEFMLEYRSIESTLRVINESSSIKKIISNTEEAKKRLQESIRESDGKMKMLGIIENMYSADGIKQIIMGKYIPALNDDINETLSSLSFPYTLTFDNNFNAKLQHLNKEIETDNLSTGEHKKVDIAVLCAILKMIKRKYPQLNLIFLDETVSSLDYESSTDIIRHLKEMSREMGLNIFIVSHTTLEESLFDEHLNVEKKYGYSVIAKK